MPFNAFKVKWALCFLPVMWVRVWMWKLKYTFYCVYCCCFLAFDFCWFCVVIRFFPPRHNGQWPPTSQDFYTRSYPLHYFLILILEKEPVLPFSMLSAINKGTTGTIFITYFVWCGAWLGIDPGTSRTRSQHSTTRLSRRRYTALLKSSPLWNI